MRLIGLVYDPDHVCCRYRLAAFRAPLERAGHSLELRAWPRHWWSWLALLQRVRQADAVILQRKLPARWQLRLLRRMARRLLFDFDDAVFGRDSYAPKGIHSGRRLRHFAAVCRAADAVIAGNAFLRDEASRWTNPERLHILPTCIDPERYPLARHDRCGHEVEMVWIGSSSTLSGLETIRPILERLGCRWPGLRLKLVCDRFLRLNHLPVVPVPWTQAGEATELAGADIGISWMPDDPWSRGKCGLKVLQYMAAGLPVVANPVGVQVDMVRHGENGYLAETSAEWEEAIDILARDPGLRRRMGAAGRRRAESDYSVSVGAAHWLAVLDRLHRGGWAA